jgi:hypothetical protein
LIDNKVELKKPDLGHIGSKCSGYDIYKYKTYIDKQLKIHRIYDELETIIRSAAITPKRELEALLNKLDKSITEPVPADEKKNC